MKKIKMLIAGLMFLISTVLICELTYDNIEHLLLRTYSQVCISGNISDKENLFDSFKQCAEQNDVGLIFGVSYDDNTKKHTTYYLFGVSKGEFENNLGLLHKNFKSLANGECNYVIDDWSELSPKDMISDPIIYVSGNKGDLLAFSKGMYERIGDIHINTIPPNSSIGYKAIFCAIWAFIIVMIVLVSFYDMLSQSKEISVKLVLGNHVYKAVIKNIVVDFFTLTAIFLSVLLICSEFTAVNMNISFFSLGFSLLVVFNSLVYLFMFRIDYCKALKGENSAHRLLAFNYVIKFVSVAAATISIGACIAQFENLKSQLKAKEIFGELENYQYITVQPTSDTVNSGFDNDETAMQQFAQKRSAALDLAQKYIMDNCDSITIIAAPFSYDTSQVPEDNCVFISKQAFDYLDKDIANLGDTSKPTLFLPNECDDRKVAFAKQEMRNYTDNYDIKIYDGSEIVCLDSSSTSRFTILSSPVIIYTSEEVLHEQNRFVCDISDEQLDKLESELAVYGHQVEKLSLNENFAHYQAVADAKLFIIIISAVSTVLFELVTLVSLVSLEYVVNSKEICLKKVMGRGVADRNAKLILVTSASNVAGFIAGVVVSSGFGLCSILILIIVSMLLILIEFLLIVGKAILTERKKLVKILKGGAL